MMTRCAVYLWILSLAGSVSAMPTNDRVTTQRGAQHFMHYCASCHALRYMRYNRMVLDLDLKWALAPADEPMLVSLPETEARQWFGKMPPDLSLIVRERGRVWLFAYLNGFYADATRPFGVNNRLIQQVAMPNVLAPLHDTLTTAQFEAVLHELVDFLDYVAEPAQLIRYRLGHVVLAFLCVFLTIVYLLCRVIRTTR